jgi:hypothetical protein
MKKKYKQENPVPLQEDLVEDKNEFSKAYNWTGEDSIGSLDFTKHPNEMGEKEFEKYWAWYNAKLPGFPRNDELVDD